jgi:phage shock protein C
MNTKKLYRSVNDRMIAGVCGGLGSYFKIDANLVRVILVVLSIATACFPFLLIYAICALIIPLEPTPPSDMTIQGN